MTDAPYLRNLAACRHCPRRQPPPYAGAALCLEDRREYHDNAREGRCPLGRFARCANCWSPGHTTADCPIPPGHTEEKDAVGGCGCAAPAIKTLSAMPEPEALPYNPTLSRRRWRVPTLA